MTCKDCLHYNAHKHFFATPDYEKDFDDYFNHNDVEHKCPEFLDKSEWVHLPCKAGDTAYLVNRRRYKEPCEWYMEKITIGTLYIEPVGAGEVACYIESNYGVNGGYLGESAFLTKEEAEKALEERRKDNGEIH